jgi:hypothetical protein
MNDDLSPLDRAALTLMRVLAHPDLDLETSLAVGGALATLDDDESPPTPLPAPVEPLAAEEGIAQALSELHTVIAGATDVHVSMRAALAARELRLHLRSE